MQLKPLVGLVGGFAAAALWAMAPPARAQPVQPRSDHAGPAAVPVAVVGPAPVLSAPGAHEIGAPQAALSTDTLGATMDTFISSAQPNTNFGGSARLYVGEKSPYGATRTAIQFDPSQLARNRAVTGAQMRLYLREAGPPGDQGRDVPVFRGTDTWEEGSLTWSSCNDCVDPQRLDTVKLGTSTGWYEWDITELVQRWRWPSWQDWYYKNQGVGVQGYEAEGSYRGFDSREGGNKPQLAITHVQDTTAPRSALKPLQPFYNAPDPGKDYVTLRLTWDGEDPQPATGIDYFWVLVKINNGGYNGLTSADNSPSDAWRRYDTDFRGYNGKIYNFVTYATDMAGNREPNKPNPDWITHVDWSPPETTVTALPPYVRGDIQLSWTGKDLPEGPDLFPIGLDKYEVWFNVNNSSWGLAETLPATTTSTVFVNPLEGGHYKFQIVGVDKAGNRLLPTPDSPGQVQTVVDRTPPTAQVLPIDKPLAQTSFSVSWQGNDGTGSGVATYDVQTQTGTGAWTAWLTATTATSQSFTGSLGNSYGFRARATDKAGNVGAWSRAEYALVIQPGALKYHLLAPWVSR
jgi:hypothetical protein